MNRLQVNEWAVGGGVHSLAEGATALLTEIHYFSPLNSYNSTQLRTRRMNDSFSGSW